jgi:Endonuclease-reverse transcriptase
LPDIILLQEVWHIADPNLFNLSCYHPLLFKCRSASQGGGVGIYVKKDYKFQLNPNSIFWDRIFESILIDVWVNDKHFIVGSLYRCINHPTLTPREQFTEFSELFCNMLNNLPSCELLLGGDLNLDVLKYDSCSNVSSYIDTLFANGFIQTVTKPTRCTTNSASCIDHFITNSPQSCYESIIVVSKLSDHFPVIFLRDCIKQHAKPKITLSRNFSDTNVACFSNQLLNTSK